MEVENLERALTYRAELRVTVYQILNQLGIASQAEELTDFERDTLLKIVYTSNFINDKPGAVTKILGYLSGIKAVGKPLEVREFEELTGASEAARKHAAGLKDGSIQPISRYTEETVAFEWTPEEAMIQRILANPIAGYVFHPADWDRTSSGSCLRGLLSIQEAGRRVCARRQRQPHSGRTRSVLLFWRAGCGQHSILMMRWSLDPRSPMPTWNSSRRSNRW
jgi:hypothetical protein